MTDIDVMKIYLKGEMSKFRFNGNYEGEVGKLVAKPRWIICKRYVLSVIQEKAT